MKTSVRSLAAQIEADRRRIEAMRRVEAARLKRTPPVLTPRLRDNVARFETLVQRINNPATPNKRRAELRATIAREARTSDELLLLLDAYKTP